MGYSESAWISRAAAAQGTGVRPSLDGGPFLQDIPSKPGSTRACKFLPQSHAPPSPVFVHHAEGKWKARGDLFKLLLGDVAILVQIVVLEDRLKKKKKRFLPLPDENQSPLPVAK